jgi:alcohol dehydrogenase class IV
METFSYFQPTEILFGHGRVREAGATVARYGRRCLLVSGPRASALAPVYAAVSESLRAAGVAVSHFDGVLPNPTVDSLDRGSAMARAEKADVVLGVGGGSSMDSAKAIAVGATHPGSVWDYLFFRETKPSERTLPVVAVSTTSGTGSQVTQVAVMTETGSRAKSAIYNAVVYPRACIVDPALMVTVPSHVTASTGFDAFCHAFEAFLHPGCSPYIELLALEAMRRVASRLETAVRHGTDLDARASLAWADTLAGLCIANAGVTLPHGIGMTISGACPRVMHGESLAVTYPEFLRFTWESAVAKFAAMGRILDPALAAASDRAAAEGSCAAMDGFLERIGMWLGLEGLGVSRGDVTFIADHSRDLPDYKNNPRIANRDEILAMLEKSWRR